MWLLITLMWVQISQFLQLYVKNLIALTILLFHAKTLYNKS